MMRFITSKLLIIGVFTSLSLHAQSNPWTKTTKKVDLGIAQKAAIGNADYRLFELDEKALRRSLSATKSFPVVMPNSSGNFDTYVVSKKDNIPTQLALKYPSITSYRGYKISDPSQSISFTLSDSGLQVYIISEASEYLKKVEDNVYLITKQPTDPLAKEFFSCGDEAAVKGKYQADAPQVMPMAKPELGGNTSKEPTLNTSKNLILPTEKLQASGIRKLRLAVVTAGEYSEINGTTKEGVLANIIAIVNAINGISELDLGIVYELVGTNDELIFIDKATDPYDVENQGISTNSSYLNQRTQVVIDSILGQENYDLGHLFIARDEGGLAGYGIGNAFGIGNVGTPEKGSGWSYFSKPTTGEIGFLGLVSHEFGHHLGATHTFTNLIDGYLTQSEVGSGRSIMSYGKKDSNDLLYYHYHSIRQVIESFKRIQFGIDFSTLGEFAPYTGTTIEDFTLQNYYIPVKTPFYLEVI